MASKPGRHAGRRLDRGVAAGEAGGGDAKMTTIIKPQPKQEEFLSSPADIVVY